MYPVSTVDDQTDKIRQPFSQRFVVGNRAESRVQDLHRFHDVPGVVQEPLHPQTDNGNGRPVAADLLIVFRDFSVHLRAAPLVRNDPVGQFPMCLPALPALHDTEAPDLRKLTVQVFGESPDFSPARPAHEEIAGTAGARDKFGISQMVRAVRVFFCLPDADHDSSEGDLLPAPDPLCLRARFFGFIALVFPGAIPPPLYHIFPTKWSGSPTICSGVASGYAVDRQTGYSVANTHHTAKILLSRKEKRPTTISAISLVCLILSQLIF